MKRNCLVIGIILLCVGTSTITMIAQDTIKISLSTSNGHWLYVGGSGTGNYTKIQDAIDNASDDDYIFVFSGIYYENILIYKSLHLLGEKPDTTIIDGHGFKEVVIITADYVTIEQFTIRNSSHNLPYSYQRGIRVEANHTTISKNIIFDNLQTGIFLDQTSYSIISENNISQSCHGIWVLESSDNTITHNTIYDNTFGVLMSSSSKNQIIANIIHHNYEDGILLSHSTQNIVLNNTIYLNENDSIGINLDEAAYMNIIKSNIIAFHRNIGISTMGFFNVISDNTIQGNGLGIDLKAGYYNQIHRNNFIENHLDAEFTLGAICRILIPLARNNWIHNYWDDHHIRLPQLIPGTLSYPPDPSIPWERISIDWIEIDWFPAKEPYDIPKMK